MKLSLLVISTLSVFSSLAQQGYREADIIHNFNAPVILNAPSTEGNFNSLKADITIIDFFGTWCAPCLKALPVLDRIQQQYASQVKVLLVSIEKEAQLKRFIAARKNFSFPVIVDSGNAISNLFQPPSYPYTVVLNRNNKILAITEVAEINDEKIKQWLADQSQGAAAPGKPTGGQPVQTSTSMESADNNPLTTLSAAFIYAAKTGGETAGIEAALQALPFDSLQHRLTTDDEKKTFWINIYNGYTQLILQRDPGKYKSRGKFFKAKQINIAGKKFSLDEIEHDILRRSKIKWSLGYLGKLFPGERAKLLRVDELDYRIHFALNCGAKSCPPIAFYDAANLNTQLDLATKAYLNSEATYIADKNVLQLPAIMGWFRRDFKGKKHMLQLVKKYGIVPEGKNPRISFKKYDWNLYLNNYKN